MAKKKKLKGLIFLGINLILIFAVLILVRNVVLIQIKQRIHSSFSYSQLFFSSLPPSLVIQEAESYSTAPYFAAKKISVSLSLRSIISRGRPLKVVIEEPELRISSSQKSESSLGRKGADFTIPAFLQSLYLRNGRFVFESEGLKLSSEGVNAVFSQNQNNFSLFSKIEKNHLYLNEFDQEITGDLYLALNGRGKRIHVNRFHIKGPEGIIKADGTIDDIFQPEMELNTSGSLSSPLIAVLLNIPFQWEGDVQENGELVRREQQVFYKSQISSPSLVLNNVPVGRLEGQVRYNSTRGGNIQLWLRDPKAGPGQINIDFEKGSVRGQVRQVSLQPIANEISVPWPVYSKAWGEFNLKNRRLVVDANFRDNTERIDSRKFPLNGTARVEWDTDKNVLFSSPSIQSSFGNLEVRGELNIHQDLDITINGDIQDLRQAREFTGLILEKEFQFPDIRGNGEAEIQIFGKYETPQVKSNFTMMQGGFDQFDAKYVKGTIELIKDDFFGRFDVEDPSFKGLLGLFTNPNETRVEIRCDRGETGVILSALDISLPLQGQGSGRFEYMEKNGETEFNGVFSGEQINFAGQDLSNVKGRINGDEEAVKFPELTFNFFKGMVKGNLMLNPEKGSFDVDLTGEDIDLSSIDENLNGLVAFQLKGNGEFGEDLISGSYDIENLEFSSFEEIASQGDIKISYAENKISLNINGNFNPGDNEFQWNIDIPLEKQDVSGTLEGSFNNLDLLLPWKGAEGKVNYLLDLKLPAGKPEIKGAVDFKGSLLPFPNFPHALEDFSGLVFVDSSRLSIRSVKGTLALGSLEASGTIELGGSGVRSMNIDASGNQMMVSILERTQALTNGEMNLVKNEAGFVLNGDFFVEKMLWRRELDEEISFSSEAYPSYSEEPGFFDGLNLNIRLRADKDAWVENSLGTIQAGFDLNIKGSVFSPVLQGEIETIEGVVNFQDREFTLLQGRVSFFNPASIDPYINFKGETYVKNYHVTFSLDGPLSNLRPEFSSSPPLPPEDVLALLALGQAFRRTYHYDRSIGQTTASLLSFQLSEEAKKRAEQLFSIDRFRIDPFIMGSSAEMTARLTLGKKLSRNFFILYSTNLAVQREDITRIEWELSNDFSIVGTRDELGRISFDVKIHRRF
ncbi:MAG: hypothetical protein GF421_02490 [Candidatus Aminicenantes bacterium]|nr:hypothetical protein [Candidatus Aminicenantes bacterium]